MLTIGGDMIYRDGCLIGQVMSGSFDGGWKFCVSGTQNLSAADMEFILIVLKARDIGA